MNVMRLVLVYDEMVLFAQLSAITTCLANYIGFVVHFFSLPLFIHPTCYCMYGMLSFIAPLVSITIHSTRCANASDLTLYYVPVF